MPRTTPLPERERVICERVKAFRAQRGLSRAALARAISVNRFTLADIERGRCPVGFACGYNFALTYNLSMKWLASGEMPNTPFNPVSKRILATVGGNDSFLSVYESRLKHLDEEALREEARLAGVPVEELGRRQLIASNRRLGASTAEAHFERVIQAVEEHGAQLSGEMLLAFAGELERLLFQRWNAHGKPMVDIKAEADNLPGMASAIPSWKQLVSELKRKTSEPGVKAQLAAELKTTRQNVNKWLRGKGAPTADVVLELLRRVRKPGGVLKKGKS